jgi:hypothetical protein
LLTSDNKSAFFYGKMRFWGYNEKFADLVCQTGMAAAAGVRMTTLLSL